MSNFVLPPLNGCLDVKRLRDPTVKWLVDESLGGREDRYTWWTSPKTHYQLNVNVLRSGAMGGATFDEFQQLVTHFVRHFGGLDSFLMTDPEDASVTDHGFGVGDGTTTTFQLQRTLGGQVWDTLGGPWATSSKPRRNLLVRSAEFTDAGVWGWVGTSLTGNTALAPDGTMTAARAVTGASSYLCQSATVVPERQYVFSWWAKNHGGSSANYAIYDNTHASWITQGTSYVQELSGAEWRRVSVAFTAPAGCTSALVDMLRDSAGSDIYLWGAQLESGVAPTRYIPTAAAAVTVNPVFWPAIADGFEPVWDPAPGPTIYVDGVAQTLGTHYTLGSTGVVSLLSPPASGAVLSWTGGIYKRVRFDTEGLPLSRIVQGIWEGKGIALVTVKP